MGESVNQGIWFYLAGGGGRKGNRIVAKCGAAGSWLVEELVLPGFTGPNLGLALGGARLAVDVGVRRSAITRSISIGERGLRLPWLGRIWSSRSMTG